MKKLKNLTFACLLILGLAACADDGKSSNNPPVTDNSETVILEYTGEIGKDNVNTITFTNPHATEADLDATIYQYTMEGSVVFDTANTTCDEFVNSNGNYEVRSKLAAGASCEIKYTYKPTELNTKILWIDADYYKTYKALCPTPITIPTLDQLRDYNRYVQMKILNYTVDSKGNKSPKYTNIIIPVEWSAFEIKNDITLHTSKTATLNIPIKKGAYSYRIFNSVLTSNNNNCSVSDNILNVYNDNGCYLTISTIEKYISPFDFISLQPEGEHYNITIDKKYEYYILNTEHSIPTFYPKYIVNKLNDSDNLIVAVLKKGEKITSYEITGIYADKFKVAGTKHNSCIITDTEIYVPENQQTCFFTIDLKDISIIAEYTATLHTIYNSGTSQIYNIESSNKYELEQFLQNYCSIFSK